MRDFHGEASKSYITRRIRGIKLLIMEESFRYQTYDHGIHARVGRGEIGGVVTDIIRGL
jgi:hypothetical protein